MFSADAYRAADEIITDVKNATGIDYSWNRDEIAEVFDEYLWNGNWDWITDFAPPMRDLRFIQEDEFDQHATSDMPDHDEQICYSAGHYVFFS